MGLLPTRAAAGAPLISDRALPAWRANPIEAGGTAPLGGIPPSRLPARPDVLALEAPEEDEDRGKELVGEYYAFIGDRLKARHQQNRKLELTVDGFRRGAWSTAVERAEAEGLEPPPRLDLSPGELQELERLRGYKERCAFYLAKLDRVLAAVSTLLAEADSGPSSEVVAWR